MRREVYGTSGPRILLWFDLLNATAGRAPMGSRADAARDAALRGARASAASCSCRAAPSRRARRCRASASTRCASASATTRPTRASAIAAIEVVRDPPAAPTASDLAARIEDPWLRFACPPDPDGCVGALRGSRSSALGATRVYYVRALQAATPAINGANLRTRFDADGNAIGVEPCYGGWRTRARRRMPRPGAASARGRRRSSSTRRAFRAEVRRTVQSVASSAASMVSS